MVADADVLDWRRRYEPEGQYEDVIFRRDPEARLAFLRRLYACGILGFSTRPRGRVTAFFVSKKANKQRLVLDCRHINQMFRKPPKPDLGSADAYSRLRPPSGASVYIAEADVQNCFYQIGVPAWLSDFFAFEDIPADFARQLGATCCTDGSPLPAAGRLAPVLTVLPMGWSWSFWLVQVMR